MTHVHSTISSSVTLLSFLPSIFPRVRVFSNELVLPIRWPKYWIFSFSISPPKECSGLIFFGLTGWISLQFKGLSRVFFSNTTVQKHQFFSAQPSLWSNSHPYTPNGKAIALTRWTSVGKVMCLLFNTLSRFVIVFLSKKQVSFNFMAAFTICSDFGAHENKDRDCFYCFPIYLP